MSSLELGESYKAEVLRRMLDARLLDTIVGANPVAGSESIVTVPGDEAWDVYSFVITLVTSAVVANRRPSLVKDDGTNAFSFNDANTAQAAGVTTTYSWVAGLGFEKTALLAGRLEIGMACLTLRGGWRIRTQTLSLDVGDDYGAPTLLVRRYSPGYLLQQADILQAELGDF